jgi:hypothetical protein
MNFDITKQQWLPNEMVILSFCKYISIAYDDGVPLHDDFNNENKK